MERKIVVPEEMLYDAWEALRAANGYPHRASQDAEDLRKQAGIAVHAALHRLSRNPIVPSPERVTKLTLDSPKGLASKQLLAWGIAEWQRRMFLAPEPEVPEAIKDMIFVKGIASAEDVISEMPRGEIDKLILEAYRRGQKEGKQ